MVNFSTSVALPYASTLPTLTSGHATVLVLLVIGASGTGCSRTFVTHEFIVITHVTAHIGTITSGRLESVAKVGSAIGVAVSRGIQA